MAPGFKAEGAAKNDMIPGTSVYFWRTKQPYSKKIDFIEEYNGQLTAFECNFSEESQAKLPNDFVTVYGDIPFHVVNPKNIYNFVMNPPE